MIATTPAEQKQHRTAACLVLVMSVLWAIAETLPTLLTPGYSLYQVIWMRYGTHILCMLLLLPRQGWSLFRTRRPALQIGRGLLMIVMPVSYIASIGLAKGLDVLAVFWVVPLLLMAIAAQIQRDRAGLLLWCAAGASELGALLILRPGAGMLAAAPFGLGMALSFSLYVVLTRTLRTEHTATNLLYSALVVFVPLTFAMPAIWQPLTLRDGLLMAGVGLAGLGVLWALDRACDLAPISVMAPLFPLQLVIMAVALPLFTGARPAKLALAGTALIAGAAGTRWLSSIKRSVGTTPPVAIVQVKDS